MRANICPVCSGRGFMSKSFYQHYWQPSTGVDNNHEMCRSCNGKGYILIDQDNKCKCKKNDPPTIPTTASNSIYATNYTKPITLNTASTQI